MTEGIARIAEVWRYPVKSMLGEQLDGVRVDERGLEGDRLFAVTDRRGKLGSGKTTRRFRLLKGLFAFTARTREGECVVTLPDARELVVGSAALDEALSAHYGEELRVAREHAVSHFDVAPVHVLTTASLAWLGELLGEGVAVRRFRPNLLLELDGRARTEEEWIGAELHVGTCVLRVRSTAERCVMVNNAQTELLYDANVLRTLARRNDTQLGVYADVVVPGAVSVGDMLTSGSAGTGPG